MEPDVPKPTQPIDEAVRHPITGGANPHFQKLKVDTGSRWGWWITLGIVLLIVGVLLIPWFRARLETRDRVFEAAALLAKAQVHLDQGHLEAAESTAQEALKLVPGEAGATRLAAAAKKALQLQKEREQRAKTAMEAAEKLVSADQLPDAISAFEAIAAKSVEFPEGIGAKAAARAAELRALKGKLMLPTGWPADAVISLKGEPLDITSGIPLGEHELIITRKGYRNPAPLRLAFNGVKPVPLPPVTWKPIGGEVTVSSVPAGAAIWIGNRNSGKVTPWTFQDVDVGKVEYILKLKGHVDKPVSADVVSGAHHVPSVHLTETTSLPSDGRVAGERREFNLSPNVKVAFRWCPPGTFMMGGNDRVAAPDEKPLRSITLTKGFWLAETEFTQGQWEGIDGRPSLLLLITKRQPGAPPAAENPQHPMLSASWDRICGDNKRTGGLLGKINAFLRSNRSTGWVVDLPTEAQWEYACRAGSKGAFGIDPAKPITPDNLAWHQGNSGGVIHPVGLKAANPWGLKDMHGNAREWTRNWYHHDKNSSPMKDPAGPSSGWKIAVRGGSSLTALAECRSSSRAQAYSSVAHHSMGFRLILRKPETPPPVVKKPAPPKKKPAPPPKKKPAPKPPKKKK